MDVSWPYKRRELGDTINYACPNNRLTWEEGLRLVSWVFLELLIKFLYFDQRSDCDMHLAQTE